MGHMDNAELKREADLLIDRCGLAELLAAYRGWFVGGSYSYDLMCWRDLDIYILDPTYDLRRCFDVAYELTRRLPAYKSRFTNSIGGEPSGLYWGIRTGDVRRGAWKLDVWFLNESGYEEHSAYSSRMRERLTPQSRANILAIKEAYWQHPSFRAHITSDQIYRAVLDHGVSTVTDFERFLEKN